MQLKVRVVHRALSLLYDVVSRLVYSLHGSALEAITEKYIVIADIRMQRKFLLYCHFGRTSHAINYYLSSLRTFVKVIL